MVFFLPLQRTGMFSSETNISNVRFSSSLLTLPSIRSYGRSNHVRWLLIHLLFSRQQPDMRQVATRTIACGSHHTPAGTRTAADCSSQPAAVVVVPLLQITQSHPSRLNHNPQPWPSLLQIPESWVIICLSVVLLLSVADFFNSLVDDLPI